MIKTMRIFLLGMIAAGTLLAFQNCGQAPEEETASESSSSAGMSPYDFLVPKIISAPQTLSSTLLQNLDLKVVVGGSEVRYQWYKDDKVIPGASSSTLNIESTAESDSGLYTLKAYNRYGDAEVDVNLTVKAGPDQHPPTIATAPSPAYFTTRFINGLPVYTVLNQGGDTNIVTFTVIATTENLRYQWYKLDSKGDPAAIPGALNNTYSFVVDSTNLVGTYRVVVTNDFGSAMAQTTLSQSP